MGGLQTGLPIETARMAPPWHYYGQVVDACLMSPAAARLGGRFQLGS